MYLHLVNKNKRCRLVYKGCRTINAIIVDQRNFEIEQIGKVSAALSVYKICKENN